MILRKWEKLPHEIQTKNVRKYYDILKKKQYSLILKRFFDIVMSIILLILLSPLFLILAIFIKIDSKGSAFYKQVRVTQYGKHFKIYKFRSMVTGADKGSQVTINQDQRITKVGRFLRKYRLDEIPQLLNIITGDMTFVGTRPEVVKYVDKYDEEMMATLLLPAGVTSETSILYKDEERILLQSDDIDTTYIKKIMPDKMVYNLQYIKEFNFFKDLIIIMRTLSAVFTKKKS